MNRIELACIALLASAMVLGGLVLHQLSKTESRADAALVIAKDDFIMMTAQSSRNEESLFVLDNRNENLLIYVVELRGTRGRMELKNYVDLKKLFAQPVPPRP